MFLVMMVITMLVLVMVMVMVMICRRNCNIDQSSPPLAHATNASRASSFVATYIYSVWNSLIACSQVQWYSRSLYAFLVKVLHLVGDIFTSFSFDHHAVSTWNVHWLRSRCTSVEFFASACNINVTATGWVVGWRSKVRMLETRRVWKVHTIRK